LLVVVVVLLLLLLRNQLSLQLMLILVLPCNELGLEDLQLPDLFGRGRSLRLSLSLSLSLGGRGGGLLLRGATILIGDGGELKHPDFFR
jgi:hypothetical protein